MEILNKQNRLPQSLFQKVWEKKQEKTIEVIEKNASVDPQKIRLHTGTAQYHRVCVTNSIRKTAVLMLEKTGQIKHMDFVISNEDVSTPKPSPEGYLKAIAKLNLKPVECIIVEDSPKGIAAAKASGANVYEVSGYTEVTLENVMRKIFQFNT
jgi:beta-phosphoglucomutase